MSNQMNTLPFSSPPSAIRWRGGEAVSPGVKGIYVRVCPKRRISRVVPTSGPVFTWQRARHAHAQARPRPREPELRGWDDLSLHKPPAGSTAPEVRSLASVAPTQNPRPGSSAKQAWDERTLQPACTTQYLLLMKMSSMRMEPRRSR